MTTDIPFGKINKVNWKITQHAECKKQKEQRANEITTHIEWVYVRTHTNCFRFFFSFSFRYSLFVSFFFFFLLLLIFAARINIYFPFAKKRTTTNRRPNERIIIMICRCQLCKQQVACRREHSRQWWYDPMHYYYYSLSSMWYAMAATDIDRLMPRTTMMIIICRQTSKHIFILSLPRNGVRTAYSVCTATNTEQTQTHYPQWCFSPFFHSFFHLQEKKKKMKKTKNH